MNVEEREAHRQFEDEVRRIARELWPEAQYQGAAMVEGQERDGIFETEECIHLLEATTSKSMRKAEQDVRKLVTLARKVRNRSGTKAVKCWFVTREEPTADQRKHTDKHKDLVNALSFSQFQSRLIDTRAYLSARDNAPFGSVRDPGTGRGEPPVEYIHLQLAKNGDDALGDADGLVDAILKGERVVLLGDYGAGKSMTMRYLFRKLRAAHLSGKTSQFPVYINLREHFGQTDPCEVLERHARNVGFEKGGHLVRAWRAGYVHLILDGFDELTGLNIQGLWKKLQDNRYRAMEAVRRLVREHQSGGIVVAGRAHFFDSDRERRSALSTGDDFVEYSLTEFSDAQISDYLNKSGIAGSIPQWLPSRPLLVGYLAARGLLTTLTEPADSDTAALDPAIGWDYLLDRISAREAEIEAGIDGRTVRRILERLATKARQFQGGLGPLNSEALIDAFTEICGYAPDERGMVLLQRLPGLGIDRGEVETRSFIDQDFGDACRAGDIKEFIDNPYSEYDSLLSALECGVGNIAIPIIARSFTSQDVPFGKMTAALSSAQKTGANYLLSDLVRAALFLGLDISDPVYVREVLVPEVEFSDGMGDLAMVEYQDCYFNTISIDSGVPSARLPRFVHSYIAAVEGRISAQDLPDERFVDCEIDEFISDADTTNAVLALELPMGVKVLLTVLKKLYEQKGAGRRENALYRGLDHRAQRYVPQVLKIIAQENLAATCKRGADTIWLTDRSNRARVGRIIASPATTDDSLLNAAKDL